MEHMHVCYLWASKHCMRDTISGSNKVDNGAKYAVWLEPGCCHGGGDVDNRDPVVCTCLLKASIDLCLHTCDTSERSQRPVVVRYALSYIDGTVLQDASVHECKL